MSQRPFKVGDNVKVARTYPIDRDYPITHSEDVDMWGLLGTVVASEYGYIDSVYVFVEPKGFLFNNWPKKQRFDPLTYWHFLPEELDHV